MEKIALESHNIIDFILKSLLFFGISGLIVPLLQRQKISPVLAYLICGIIIGPYGIAQFSDGHPWIGFFSIDNPKTVHILGEFGIIFLMFMIGLRLSLESLKELSRYIFGLGTLQILITALIIFAIAIRFDNSLQAAVLLGSSFALSSTAIVMKLLEEEKISNRPIGILCFSVLLMQDLAVVPILVMATFFSGNIETSITVALGKSFLLGVVTVVGIYWLGKKVLTPVLKFVSFSTTPEWLAAFIVFILLACSTLTYIGGLSLALGAFLAGLLVAETDFQHEVEVIINPLKSFLLGIFFLSIGMMIDLATIASYPTLLPLSVLGIYLLKACIILMLCLAFHIPGRQAAEASIYLAQPGEFALMILGVAMSTKLMPTTHVQFFLLVAVVSMMLTPVIFKLAPMAGNLGHRMFGQHKMSSLSKEVTTDHKVVIAGFGRVGQLIAKVLEEQHIGYIAFDLDGERVQQLKEQNFQVIYGDARKVEFWRHLIDKNIQVAIIAIDDYLATKNILNSLRQQFPLLPAIARSKDIEDLNKLYDQGASDVVAETQESSLRIAQLAMEKISNNPEETREIINKIRMFYS